MKFLSTLIYLISKKALMTKLGFRALRHLLGQLEIRVLRNLNHQFCILLIIVLALISYLVSPISIHAQDSTESGLLNKLNELKSEIASKAAQLKTQVSKKVQNKAFIGMILSNSSGEISLQTTSGQKTIKHDEFTEIIGAKNKKIKIDTLEDGDRIAALGDVDDKNNLVAQKLIYLENFATNSAELVWGQIQKSSAPTITIKTRDGETKNILTNSSTVFFLGNEEASIADSKVEKHLLARAVKLKDGSYRARFIYFIPSMGFTKPIEKQNPLIKSASPSASLKPSPKP